MNKAFLSHSSKQKDFVGPIYTNLGRNNAVYDCMTFEIGGKTVDEIFAGIQSSDLFVLFLSESAVESTWVQQEIESARKLLTSNVKRVLPILIDKNLDRTDERIPSWLREKYNLHHITNHQIVLNKIKNALNELAIDTYPAVKAKAELFIGRNRIMDNFEEQITLRGRNKPSCIVISGHKGVGRKTFLSHALEKTGLAKLGYEPMTISLDEQESIESAILNLSSKGGGVDPFALEVTSADMPTKIAYLQRQVADIIKSGEILQIIDVGVIVLHNRRLADWFLKFLDHPEFKNTLSVCVISKYRPFSAAELDLENVMTLRVDEMVNFETISLLRRYSTLIKSPLTDDAVDFFAPYLHGMPEQTHYACHLVRDIGFGPAKNQVQKIIDKGRSKIEHIVSAYMDNNNAMQLLSLLSKLEFISFSYLYRIIGETEENRKLVADFYANGIYNRVGVNKEYIRMNHAVADYMNRSKFDVSGVHWRKVREELKRFLEEPMNVTDLDAAQLLFSVRQALLQKSKLPKQYYIPAFALRTIVELYNNRQYPEVIELSYTSLQYQTISDKEVVRELRNWLCLALAREKDSRFNNEVKFATGDEYYFLMGFNYRMHKKLPDAEREYKKINRNSSAFRRVRKELANIYLEQKEYEKALSYAKEIYEEEPGNAYYIQSYFMSLVRKGKEQLSPEDYHVLDTLLNGIKNSLYEKAASIGTIMNAEYLFYARDDYGNAQEILNNAIASGTGSKRFMYRCLLEMHRKRKNFPAIEATMESLDKL